MTVPAGQLSLDLFEAGSPTWDDVQKGKARLVDTIGPCEGPGCMFWHGGCTHTADGYAFPKKRPGGMCLQHRLEWA